MSDDQLFNAKTASVVLQQMKSRATEAAITTAEQLKRPYTEESGGESLKLSSDGTKSNQEEAGSRLSDLDNSSSSNGRSQPAKVKRMTRGTERVVFPVEPRVIQVVKKPRTFTNHSYRDFSSVPPAPNEIVPTEISEMTFPQKVHHILSQPQYSRFVCWQPHGRAFRITIPKLFESEVCPKYLGHTRYSSFLRQLSNHSFKHITKGEDRNCYYHEFMLRGLPHLCKYMPRPKDARRLIPDPDNEPDFYAISKAFPLPDTREPQSTETQGNDAKAGSRRLASSNLACTKDEQPAAKRARVFVSELKGVGQADSAVTVPPAVEGIHPLANITPMSPTPTLAPTLAASLLAATTSGTATLPTTQMSSMSNPSAPGSSNALGLNWAALRAPQMQAAADRNTILLQALRAGLNNQVAAPAPPTPPPPASSDLASTLVAALAAMVPPAAQAPSPPSSSDQATTLAAALIRQFVNDSERNTSDPNSALASLTALVRGNLSN